MIRSIISSLKSEDSRGEKNFGNSKNETLSETTRNFPTITMKTTRFFYFLVGEGRGG
jgi:hypothetical protein